MLVQCHVHPESYPIPRFEKGENCSGQVQASRAELPLHCGGNCLTVPKSTVAEGYALRRNQHLPGLSEAGLETPLALSEAVAPSYVPLLKWGLDFDRGFPSNQTLHHRACEHHCSGARLKHKTFQHYYVHSNLTRKGGPGRTECLTWEEPFFSPLLQLIWVSILICKKHLDSPTTWEKCRARVINLLGHSASATGLINLDYFP